MDGNINKISIAKGREEKIEYVTADVFEEEEIREAPSESIGREIYMKTRSMELFSEDPEERNSHENSITKENITRNEEHTCPFLKVGFMNPLTSEVKLTKKKETLANKDLLQKHDISNIMFIEQNIVSRALIENGLVAARFNTEPELQPELIPLSSSMASLTNNKWNKFKIQDRILPKKLVDDCLNSSEMTKIEQDHQQLRIVGILCGKMFENTEDLNAVSYTHLTLPTKA